jgi:hypothetical protein
MTKIFPDWTKAKDIGHSYKRRLVDYHGIDDPYVWALVCHFYLNCCLKCGKNFHGRWFKLTPDHVHGDYRKKGIKELQPLCNRCNTVKGQENKDYRPDNGEMMVEYVDLMYESWQSFEEANKENLTFDDWLKMRQEPMGVQKYIRNGRHGYTQLGLDFFDGETLE